MKIIKTVSELRTVICQYKAAGKTIALVPTMGYFHQGHLSLMETARQKADVVVTTLFVNPTQFAPNEDLAVYPRDFERDARLADEQGVDILFSPEPGEMYPAPFYTYVITEKLDKVLCGATRQTHFRGVTTIVAKLFNLVQPDWAIFGQKDFQQAVIIRRMAQDLNFPIEIIVAPIVRENDGLAMSSRNTYLTAEERKQAIVLNQALTAAESAVAKGENQASEIKALIRSIISTSPLARIDYVEISEDVNLTPVETIIPGTFAALAVYYGKTRLIDNRILKKLEPQD